MFIELSYNYVNQGQGTGGGQSTSRQYFIMDFHSGWEIYDHGNAPTHWSNNTLGMNKSVSETYAEIKAKLIKSGLLIE